MTHRPNHSHDTSARLAAATGQGRYGASWVATAIVGGGTRAEGDARPTGRVIRFVGDRKHGRTYVSAGDGGGGDTR